MDIKKDFKKGPNVCPKCGKKFSAHKDNSKTFKQLTPGEKEKSITVMAINLKKAINSDLVSTRARRLSWVISYMGKK